MRSGNQNSFSIRTLLILTAVVASHLAFPFLQRALVSTVAFAILLYIVFMIPLSGVLILDFLKLGSLPNTGRETAIRWLGLIAIILISIFYACALGAELAGLIGY